MFDNLFLNNLKKTLIFIIIYTVIFYMFFSTITYTLPFVLAFLIAIWTRPCCNFLKRKFNIPKGLSSILSTIMIISIGIFIIVIIVYNLTIEAKTLLLAMPDMKNISRDIYDHGDKLKIYYDKIDPDLAKKIHQQVFSSLSGIFDITVKVLNRIISLAIGLPILLMIIFITLIATYFFSQDIDFIESKFFNIFSQNGKEKAHKIIKESNKMFFGYIRAYMTIISITFLETFIGFSILKIKYAFILACIAAIVDILPIFGVGAVYMPIVIGSFIMGNYFVCIGVLTLYVLVNIVRQILEPKLVATTVGVYPVAILAAIFIGLKSYGFLGMIYLIFLIIFYNILKKSEVL